MKARKFIGGTIAVVGLMAAVCVCDGSAHELLIRIGGTVLFAVGAYVARLFDFQNQKS